MSIKHTSCVDQKEKLVCAHVRVRVSMNVCLFDRTLESLQKGREEISSEERVRPFVLSDLAARARLFHTFSSLGISADIRPYVQASVLSCIEMRACSGQTEGKEKTCGEKKIGQHSGGNGSVEFIPIIPLSKKNAKSSITHGIWPSNFICFSIYRFATLVKRTFQRRNTSICICGKKMLHRRAIFHDYCFLFSLRVSLFS